MTTRDILRGWCGYPGCGRTVYVTRIAVETAYVNILPLLRCYQHHGDSS